MEKPLSLLAKRRNYSKNQLTALQSRLTSFEVVNELQDLCIYVTGSYGRLEASEHSDIDLFFIHKGTSYDNAISKIKKTLLDADLIRTIRDLGYPAFSNDGEYLSVHYIDDIKKTLGGRDDDFENHFTARLLLLLESRALHNQEVYKDALQEIIASYFRDYEGHETSFRPLFLINDILRFWRTLCLNYEHRRNRAEEDAKRRNKDHLINLKLKFSRLLTCHSAIVLLSANGGVIEPNELIDIINISPLERLDKIAAMKPSTSSIVENMKETYSWFLTKTGQEHEDVIRWIDDSENRAEALDKGRAFATMMYEIMCEVSDGTDIMRYLVI